MEGDLNAAAGELDLALERFQRTAPEFAGGLANHGPMAAEALVALGHEALVPAFVERYAPRLPAFEAGSPLPEGEWRGARGRPERVADWVATFEALLRERAFGDVLAEHVPGLLPGLFASAAHGLLRTAHAVRALAASDTEVRRRELAHGLGLWAARYQELPGHPGEAPSAGASLAEIAPLPPERRVGGFFFEQVAPLAGHEPFAAWVAALGSDGDPGARIGALAREGASLYLEHPHQRILYTHVVTAPSALRLLAPHLPEDAAAALGFAWQAAGALHAIGDGPCEPDARERAEAERTAADPAEIAYRAACSLDDHAIKLAEACLREDAIAPARALRLAAADAALHSGGPQRSC